MSRHGTAYDRSICDDPSLVRENLRLENARRFVMSMCRDQQGRLWVGTENEQPGDGTGGVQCFDPSAPPLHQWTQYIIKDGLGDDNGYAIACDHQNRIWVGHLNHGVSVFNHNSKGHWQCYEVVGGLSRPDTLSGPIGERVFAIKCCPTDGDVWMATNCGLARYSDSKQTWTYLTRADGLPSDQANALAFDNAGNLYIGTQCDGIAMADAADNYRTWRTAAGPDEEPTTPTGDGLPTNLINDVLVTNDATVYAATTTGLAWSKDRGHQWNYIRGKDYADKVRGRYGGPPTGWAEQPGATLTEDYCTCLAWDAISQCPRIGHREHGIDHISLPSREDRGLAALTGKTQSEFIQAMIPASQALVIATYGNGILGAALPSSVAARPDHVVEPRLPLGANSSTTTKLADSNQAASVHPCAAYPIAAYVGEDWTTGGDWIGRYGRQYAILCADGSPLDQYLTLDNRIKVVGDIGPDARRDDGLRHWLHWETSDQRRVLWDPLCGHRRQGEWDDHGEAYPMVRHGPGLWITVEVPAGIYGIDLYFVNKDGHDAANRYRDYVVSVREWASDSVTAEQSRPLGTARVRDFWGGVYERFAMRGPAKYFVEASRNHSLNTICSAVFVNRIAGPPGPNDDMALPGLGNLAYGPLGSDTPGSGPLKWIGALSPAHPAFQAIGVKEYREYRAAATDADAAARRWTLKLWTPEDRAVFDRTMHEAWSATIAQNPQLANRR